MALCRKVLNWNNFTNIGFLLSNHSYARLFRLALGTAVGRCTKIRKDWNSVGHITLCPVVILIYRFRCFTQSPPSFHNHSNLSYHSTLLSKLLTVSLNKPFWSQRLIPLAIKYFKWQQFTGYTQPKLPVTPQQIRILASQLSFSFWH
jgi:hypothetical protein